MTLESKLVKLRDHLDRFLGVYVAISIVIAFIIGLRYAQPVHQNINAIKSLEMVAIIIMIFPMMVMMNVSGLAKAVKNWKLLLIVLLMNFGWGPLMAIILGDLFVSNPLIRLGIFLAWLVPCSSMSIGYVGLMRGSIEAATALVAITFIIGIPIIPLFAGLYGSIYHLKISMVLLVMTIIEVILLPLIFGVITHYGLIKWMGKDKFIEISPIFPTLTMLGMFMIVFLIFLPNSPMVIKNFHEIIGVFYTAMVFGTVSLIFLTVLLKKLKINYWDSMAALFPSIGKNEATAIAIASTAFSPLVAIPPGMFPIFQIIFLVTYIKLRPNIAHYFGIKGKDVKFMHEDEVSKTGGE